MAANNTFSGSLNAMFKENYADKIEDLIPDGVKLLNEVKFMPKDKQPGNLQTDGDCGLEPHLNGRILERNNTLQNYKVYLIRDKSNDIKYVGLTSQPLSRRFAQHVSKRKLNKDEFKIELVTDYLTIDEAVILEEMLIKQHNTRITGFNVSPKSINGYSNLHSDEQKQKWSEERRNKKVSEEHAAKNRIARLGHTNSPEHQAKIIRPKPVICLETGTVYKSAREAAKELNLQYSKISLVCTGKRSSTGGLHFKFV